MIVKTTSPGSASVDVDIDGVFYDPMSVVRVETELGENEHDLAVIYMAGIPPRSITNMLNRPVKITTRINTTLRSVFYGYVISTHPLAVTREGRLNNSLFQQTKIVCLGASSDLRSKKTRTWEEPLLADIATALSEEYRLSFTIPRDRFRLPRLVQRGESDWNLLVKAASKLGYAVTCHGTNIHVYDPSKLLGRGLPFIELTTPKQENLGYAPGRILEFDGSFRPSLHAKDKRVHFLDVMGTSFNISTSELGLRDYYGRPLESRITEEQVINASSYEEAAKALTAIENFHFAFNAKVVTTGVPDAVPGSIAQLNNYNSNFDGFWVVRSVHHTVVRDGFTTEFQISRNTTNDDPPTLPSIDRYREPPVPLLIGDKWKSRVTVRDQYD